MISNSGTYPLDDVTSKTLLLDKSKFPRLELELKSDRTLIR
ncbi:hypothetical protein [Moorena producens]